MEPCCGVRVGRELERITAGLGKSREPWGWHGDRLVVVVVLAAKPVPVAPRYMAVRSSAPLVLSSTVEYRSGTC